MLNLTCKSPQGIKAKYYFVIDHSAKVIENETNNWGHIEISAHRFTRAVIIGLHLFSILHFQTLIIWYLFFALNAQYMFGVKVMEKELSQSIIVFSSNIKIALICECNLINWWNNASIIASTFH